jgi:hypothetical protein
MATMTANLVNLSGAETHDDWPPQMARRLNAASDRERNRSQTMHPALATAFNAEVQCADRAFANDNLVEAFAHLERAHILGQWYVRSHLITHLGMLRIGWRRRDVREIVGQLLRIPGGIVGSAIGRVPRGNTGGARVGAFRSLPIATDLKELLAHDRRSRLD